MTPSSEWSGPKTLEIRDGRLVGFAFALSIGIACLEHLWVCDESRRDGIATDLVRQLVADLGQPLLVGFVTDDGEAWSKNAEWSGLIRRASLR